MIDACNVYHVVSARSHIFTDEQLLNLSAITWLYRGEQRKFIGLVANYQDRVDEWLEEIPDRLADDSTQVMELAGLLNDFISGTVLYEHNTDQPDEKLISDQPGQGNGQGYQQRQAEPPPLAQDFEDDIRFSRLLKNTVFRQPDCRTGRCGHFQ